MGGDAWPPAADTLGAIVACARKTIETRAARRPPAELERALSGTDPRAAAFRDALGNPAAVNVIAECKRRSPAKGILIEQYVPARLAEAYTRGGAAAISVLTEPAFFDGALEHLAEVRAVTPRPLLRKDFVIDRYQLLEARLYGADAVLLIAAVLGARALAALLDEARQLGLAGLVEVRDRLEIDAALAAGATVIGVNSRDLHTLEVSRDRLFELVEHVPPHVVAVAESGIASRADVAALRSAGYRAFLVGGALVSSRDPEAFLRGLVGANGDAS